MEINDKVKFLYEQNELQKNTFTTQFKTIGKSLNNGISKSDKIKAAISSGLSLNIGSMLANHSIDHMRKQELKRKLKELGIKDNIINSSKTLGHLSKYQVIDAKHSDNIKKAVGAYNTFSVLRNPIGFYYARKVRKAELEDLKNHLKKNGISKSTIDKVDELRDKSEDKRTLTQKIKDNKNELFGSIFGLKNAALGYYGLYNTAKKIIDDN